MNTLNGRFRTQTVYAPGAGSGGGWPPPTNKFQEGNVNLVVGTQSYAVAFSPALTGVPAFISVQVFMPDGNGEVLYANIDLSSVTANGFTFWLNANPTIAGAKAKYQAQV